MKIIRRLAYFLIALLVIVLGIIIFVMRTMPKAPTTMDVLTVLSVYFICAYTLLVFFQIKTNLTYNKCKAATDFMFGEITAILFPKEIELPIPEARAY